MSFMSNKPEKLSLSQARWLLILLSWIAIGLPSRASDMDGATTETHTTWRAYGGAPDGAQYSALRQINRSNVKKLQVAWTYRTGDDRKYSFNPLIVDGVMYVLAKNNSIVALDAATGKEIWTHATDGKTTLITNRGIDYWESKDRSDRRSFFRSATSSRSWMLGRRIYFAGRHQRPGRPARRART